MKKYRPNFNDPRVVRRINSAINHAIACLSPTKPRGWSTRQIDRWCGQSQHPLSRLIRSHILTVDSIYYRPSSHHVKKYLLNWQGVQELAAHINKPLRDYPTQRLTSAQDAYGATIAQGTFAYKTQNNRLWNNLQFLESDLRRPLFANYGYVHEYDIKSAAPTILTHYAKQCGLTRPTRTIDSYLQDPRCQRQRIADLLEVDIKTAKQLITSRFAGAKFGARNSILNQLDGRWILHDRLKQDQWYIDLTKDIKKLWDAIRAHNQLARMHSRTKWSVYFEQELRVMKAVHKYLDLQGITYFHEHDGWRATGAVDLRGLKLHVKKQTGYWIDFDYEVVA